MHRDLGERPEGHPEGGGSAWRDRVHWQDRPEGEWEKSLPCASGCLGTFQVVGSGDVTEESKRQTYAETETGRRSTRKRQADNSSPGQERRHSFLSPVPKPQLEGPKEMGGERFEWRELKNTEMLPLVVCRNGGQV